MSVDKLKQSDYYLVQKVALHRHLKTHERQMSPMQHLRKRKSMRCKRNTHSCRLCGQFFQSLTLYYAHKQIHADEENVEFGEYTCKICEQNFDTKKRLKVHQRVHVERMFLCGVCGRRFHLKATMEAHYRVCFAKESVSSI